MEVNMMNDLISRQAALDAMENCEPGEEPFVIKSLPSAQPEPSQVARDIATIIENERDMRVIAAQPDVPDIRVGDMISRQAEIERIDRIFRDLNIACAYDMPSFWYNKGKDYAVIPTKYHKGYQRALEDAEARIMDALKDGEQDERLNQ